MTGWWLRVPVVLDEHLGLVPRTYMVIQPLITPVQGIPDPFRLLRVPGMHVVYIHTYIQAKQKIKLKKK